MKLFFFHESVSFFCHNYWLTINSPYHILHKVACYESNDLQAKDLVCAISCCDF
jgi:hypothetical protein